MHVGQTWIEGVQLLACYPFSRRQPVHARCIRDCDWSNVAANWHRWFSGIIFPASSVTVGRLKIKEKLGTGTGYLAILIEIVHCSKTYTCSICTHNNGLLPEQHGAAQWSLAVLGESSSKLSQGTMKSARCQKCPPAPPPPYPEKKMGERYILK